MPPSPSQIKKQPKKKNKYGFYVDLEDSARQKGLPNTPRRTEKVPKRLGKEAGSVSTAVNEDPNQIVEGGSIAATEDGNGTICHLFSFKHSHGKQAFKSEPVDMVNGAQAAEQENLSPLTRRFGSVSLHQPSSQPIHFPSSTTRNRDDNQDVTPRLLRDLRPALPETESGDVGRDATPQLLRDLRYIRSGRDWKCQTPFAGYSSTAASAKTTISTSEPSLAIKPTPDLVKSANTASPPNPGPSASFSIGDLTAGATLQMDQPFASLGMFDSAVPVSITSSTCTTKRLDTGASRALAPSVLSQPDSAQSIPFPVANGIQQVLPTAHQRSTVFASPTNNISATLQSHAITEEQNSGNPSEADKDTLDIHAPVTKKSTAVREHAPSRGHRNKTPVCRIIAKSRATPLRIARFAKAEARVVGRKKGGVQRAARVFKQKIKVGDLSEERLELFWRTLSELVVAKKLFTGSRLTGPHGGGPCRIEEFKNCIQAVDKTLRYGKKKFGMKEGGAALWELQNQRMLAIAGVNSSRLFLTRDAQAVLGA